MQTSHIEALLTAHGAIVPSRDTALQCFEQAKSTLNLAASKLTNPTPEVIREVQALIGTSNRYVQSALPSADILSSDDVKSFRDVCDRVCRLLEGAQIGQWNHLRHMGGYLETYQPNGSIRDYSVRSSAVDTTG